ncbi:MAG: class I SAM-dependent methyltransferase [Clostridia bacterium]|nr:class I SAM-dependent methyltransferase [Clostridia bacterium]
MDSVNKTLYIPLYGKAYVSKKSLFLQDEKAEEIWEAERFPLKGKSKSKWLAYYMGIRSAVFDDWLREQMTGAEDAVIIHIGCGMDSRILRIGEYPFMWYDIDFPDVITERKRYYAEHARYHMLAGDVRKPTWLSGIPQNKKAIVVMEGVSMYLSLRELQSVLESLCNHFAAVTLLMDCYTVLAAKMSRYKNPIKDVGVMSVYGIDDPSVLQVSGLRYVKEHAMTPKRYVDQLQGLEKWIFGRLYAGGFSKKLYKLYEYKKD